MNAETGMRCVGRKSAQSPQKGEIALACRSALLLRVCRQLVPIAEAG